MKSAFGLPRRALVVATLLASTGGCHSPRDNHHIQATYDASGKLTLLIYDSNGNARPDIWSYMDGARIVRIEIDRNEDGAIERAEFYENGALARVEEDNDDNGLVDKWETYANGVVTSVAFDLDGTGRATRRLVYDKDGQVVHTESNVDPHPRDTKP